MVVRSEAEERDWERKMRVGEWRGRRGRENGQKETERQGKEINSRESDVGNERDAQGRYRGMREKRTKIVVVCIISKSSIIGNGDRRKRVIKHISFVE